jgi:hypothetical protein
MIQVNSVEKDKILSTFPSNIKLSYENIVHKKVLNSSIVSVIPQGKKCFIWFTQQLDQSICYLLQMDLIKDNDIKGTKDNKSRIIKNITHISILTNISFDFSLSYGTILYGTMFHYVKQVFFSIEDIFYNQGIHIFQEEYYQKLVIIKRILDKKIKMDSSSSIILGLPLLETNAEEIIQKIKLLPYKIYCLLFRKNNLIFKMPIYDLYKRRFELGRASGAPDSNLTSNLVEELMSVPFEFFNGIKSMHEPEVIDQTETQNGNVNQGQTSFRKININNHNLSINNWKKEIIFKIRPDIQNDIYHLFCLDNLENEYYIDVAYIPDYKTSVFMNSLFRNIKENNNLDYLEESDDEDEFENGKEDRFVYLDRELLMYCKYHFKFKKWVPQKKVMSTSPKSKPIYHQDYMSFFSEKEKRK